MGKEPFSNYATHLARFISEYGFQSFPELKTVKSYALPEDFDINSEVMKSHQRSSIGNGTITEYMKRDYKDPKDFESFLYVGQVLQTEGIKFAMEGHRRAIPYNMGSLYWQINDCWPVASWSSTDYYQRWKTLQYFLKKAFEPVIISPYGLKDTLNIGVVSDRLQPINAIIKLKVIDFGGKVLWIEETSKEIPANSASFKLSYLKNELLKGANPVSSLLVTEIFESGKLLHSYTFYFKPVKDLNLPKPEVKTEISEVANGYNITLSSAVLAKNVYLSIDDQVETFFTDNYFDLLPGEKVTIECRTTGAKIVGFSKKLMVMTIADSF